MKQLFVFVVILCMVSGCLAGCASKEVDAIGDLSQTASIEIRVLSDGGQRPMNYVISDEDAVGDICDMFSSLELKKVKITKVIAANYEVSFLDSEGRKIEGATLIAGHNAIDCGEELYKITNDIDIEEYVADIASQREEQFFAEIGDAALGEYVRLGAYEHDPYTEYEDTSIEWLVLDKKDGKVLLLSRYGLDAQPYNVEPAEVTWEECTLRRWLNEEFYREAFSETEQNHIAESGDKVFLLSAEEVLAYFDPDSEAKDPARSVQLTKYAKKRGGDFSTDEEYYGNGRWLLRSPEANASGVAEVNYAGQIEHGSHDVGVPGVIRPTIWVEP